MMQHKKHSIISISDANSLDKDIYLSVNGFGQMQKKRTCFKYTTTKHHWNVEHLEILIKSANGKYESCEPEKGESERKERNMQNVKMQTVTIHDEAIRSNPFRNAVNPFKHYAYSNLQQTSILLVTTKY